MIIDKIVNVKITKRNIEHYIKFYKNITLGDVIEVITDTELMKGSNLKINVKCDVCIEERLISFQNYQKNITSSIDYPIYTCDKCSHVKIKATNKKKYGVDYYSETKEYSDKFKATMLNRYGVEYALQSDEFKYKLKKNNIEKYGVENTFQVSEFKDKTKQTFLKNFNVDHFSKTDEFKDKFKQTMLNRYGVEYTLNSKYLFDKFKQTMLNKYGSESYTKTDEFIDKVKKTNNEKYGVDWVQQNKVISDKSRLSFNKRYGVDTASQSEIFRTNFKITNDIDYINYISDSYSLFKCINSHEFEIHIDLYHSRKIHNTPLCTICNPVGDSRSIKEIEFLDYIKYNYSGEIISSHRDRYEIDVYLPELNIGFEFNGLYYHSDKFKDNNYHLMKTEYFKNIGIRLIHIWEDDWDYRKYVVKSMLLNCINKTQFSIYARKCKVVELKQGEVVMNFLDNNHIQGSVNNNTYNIGLLHDDVLVSIMCFNKFEGRNKLVSDEWNLSRFCNELNTNVVGGASKLLSYFIEKTQPKRIISYADVDWSTGNLYKILGFNFIQHSSPDYKYIVNNRRVHKQNFKKSKLNIIGNMTEKEYMRSKDFHRIYDCGKFKYELLIK